MSDTKRMTYEEWTAKGKELFGERTKDWKWVCPSCKSVQGFHDFEKLGMSVEEIRKYVNFSCIGRYNGNMNNDAFVSGKGPCNYTTGGLINISPVCVTLEDNNGEVWCFDFAEPAEAKTL